LTESTHSSLLRSGGASTAQTVESAALYQLEYTDTLGTGDVVIESGYSAADAAIYLRSILALGMSPVIVRVIA
jgi:hypothetical protein